MTMTLCTRFDHNYFIVVTKCKTLVIFAREHNMVQWTCAELKRHEKSLKRDQA